MGSDTTFRFCKLEPNFYVVHKILKVNDIPYADCYNSHQKIEFTQNATVIMDENNKPKLCLSTHIKIYFGVEWRKSTWLKTPIRSRTLMSVKADCIKYCDNLEKRILELSKSQQIQQKEVGSKTKKEKKREENQN